jgi:hypothetical protein
MNILQIIPSVSTDTLEPELSFFIKYMSDDENSAFLSAYGHVSTNFLRIAPLVMKSEDHNDDTQTLRLRLSDDNRKESKERSIRVVAPLSLRALDKIEEVRYKHNKKDVELNITITINSIETPAVGVLVHLEGSKTKVMLPDIHSNTLFSIRTQSKSQMLTISASSWLADFCPKLGMGRFKVIELPQVEIEQNTTGLHERLNRAVVQFEEVEKQYNRAEWSSVIKESRSFWELLNISDVTTLVDEENNDPEVNDAFKNLIKSFYTIGHKFQHVFAKDRITLIDAKADKEDATLMYMMAASCLNLVSHKLRKSVDRQKNQP